MIVGVRLFLYLWSSIITSIQYRQISIDPQIISVTAVFTGTRVTIKSLFDYIEGGVDITEFLYDFPSATKEGLPKIETINMYGESSHPENKHFDDQVEMYLQQKNKNDDAG